MIFYLDSRRCPNDDNDETTQQMKPKTQWVILIIWDDLARKKYQNSKTYRKHFGKIQQSARYSIWPCHQFFVVAHFCYDVTLYTFVLSAYLSLFWLSLVVKGHKDSIVYTWKGNVICIETDVTAWPRSSSHTCLAGCRLVPGQIKRNVQTRFFGMWIN